MCWTDVEARVRKLVRGIEFTRGRQRVGKGDESTNLAAAGEGKRGGVEGGEEAPDERVELACAQRQRDFNGTAAVGDAWYAIHTYDTSQWCIPRALSAACTN